MKLVKQAGTVAIASALLLTSVPQVWADEAAVSVKGISAAVMPIKGIMTPMDPKITKEQALAIAKQYIDIPSGYTLESVNLNSYAMQGGKTVPSWNLNYAKRVKDQYYGSMNITINGLSGKLTGYSLNDNDPEHKPSYPPKVDYKAAKDIAAKWIVSMNLGEKDQLQYNDRDEQAFRTPLDGNYQYNIRYDRTVDGVPFPQNGVNVSVNGDGQVTSYRNNWDDTVTFEKNVKPIGQEKAAQAFRDKAKISLNYQIPYQAKGKKEPIASYQMDTFMLNAADGEQWNPNNNSGQTTSSSEPLTDKPLGEVPSSNLNLTKEQAIEKVTSSFKIPEGAKLEDASYNEYTNPDNGEVSSQWSLRWSQPAANSNEANLKPISSYSVWAAVNSKTGELMNYNVSVPMDLTGTKTVDAKVSQEDAKSRAVDWVKKQLPAYTNQLVLDYIAEKDIPQEQLKSMSNWTFSFKRVLDGVNAGYESVSVSIDRVTGEVTSYNNSISNIGYPKQKPAVLALDKAKELLFSKYDIQLQYVAVDKMNTPYAMDGAASAKYNLMVAAGEIPPASGTDSVKEAKLVYSLISKYTQESFLLDAQTGEWKNASTGEVISLEKVKVNDIEGHWAQNELQLMLDYQALDVKDGQVNPNQAITRGEMIKMLIIAMNGGNNGIHYGAERKASFADVKADSSYFAYVENAVDRGLLDPGSDFNANAKMNREEMAQLIVKALGYKGLTKYDAIFNDNFADKVKLKNRGEAAIVVGLDIMSLTDGSFNPDQEVTKAQAAAAFFRYLQKRAEMQDNQRPRLY